MTAMQRIGRSLGIVAVFTVLGPIVVAAALLAVGLAIGIPLTVILLLIFDFKTLWQWASPILFVVVMLLMLGTLMPAFLSGIAFAVAAVYFRANSLKVAILCGVLAAIGIVMLGLVVKPTESSFLLPRVDGFDQALGTAVFLAVPAAVAAALCWLATKRLHRVSS